MRAPERGLFLSYHKPSKLLFFAYMDIKQAFIKRTLQKQGREMNDAQLRAIRKHLSFKYGHTGRLLNDRSIRVSGNKLIHRHPIYQRFLDMKTTLPNGKKRRAYPIHNKFAFYTFTMLSYKLMHGLTEEVAEEIKQSIKA